MPHVIVKLLAGRSETQKARMAADIWPFPPRADRPLPTKAGVENPPRPHVRFGEAGQGLSNDLTGHKPAAP